MAGPFASTGNQAIEIQQVQLQGGFAADAGVAGVAEAVLSKALPVITEQHESNIKEDITDQTESVKQALIATRNPALAKSLFKEEALQDPVTAEAFKQFNLIQDAAAQGKLPQQFMLERLEAIQDNAIANSPAFEREIRAAMVQATGVDPNKATFQQLLSTQKQSLTAEQRAIEKLKFDATVNGLTVEQQQEFNHAGLVAQNTQNLLDQRKASGTYSLLDTTKEVNNRSGVLMLDLLGQVRRQKEQGELTPEFIAGIKSQASQTIAASISTITAASDGVSGPALAAELAPLEALSSQIENMLDDGSFLELTQKNNLLSKSLIEEGVLNMQDYATAYAIGGPRGFVQLMQYLDKAPTEASKEVFSALSPSAKAAFNLRKIGAGVIAKQYGLMGTGAAPETNEERQARMVAAGLLLATPDASEEQYTTALAEMNALGEDNTWTAFASNKIVQATKRSNVLKAQVITLQETTTAGLGEEWAQLRANGKNMKGFKLTNSGLTYELSAGDVAGGSGFSPGIDTSAQQAFVARYNRADSISSKHARAGNLPTNRYGSQQKYFETVTTLFDAQKAELSGEKVVDGNAPAIPKWGRDDSGKPVLIN